MKRINLLPENLINQIAAGEVIERPSSVVKELVENSIDAGATKVEITVSNECRDIRIADNGSGIHKDDIALAFSRHATSKILTEKDLWKISTMGFRGEALASIISVSKVTCVSRTANEEIGTKAECENSAIKISDTGCSVGTIMEVSDIFYNVPARSKFLKKSQTEFSYIADVIQQIAIVNPHISFHLINKGSTSLRTSGSGDLSTVISEIYSRDIIKSLIEVNKDDQPYSLSITGLVSMPDFTRTSKKSVHLFVNGRPVKCPVFIKAVDTVYKDLIPSGKYPFCVLNLAVKSSDVDVNVHPAKREVRYANPNQIFNFIFSAIKHSLEDRSVEVPVFNDFDQLKSDKDFVRSISNDEPVYTPRTSFSATELYHPYEATFTKVSSPVPQVVEVVESEEQVIIDFAIDESAASRELPKIKIIGQYANTYILIEHSDGLQLVDQHIAHERAIYEKLKASKEFASQLLLAVEPVTVEPLQAELILQNIKKIEQYGYRLEIKNDNKVVLNQVPQILAAKSSEDVVAGLIEALEGSLDYIEDKILITTSCKAAVKAGEKLTIWQMEELIRDWMNTPNNWTCPHGRVISKIIPLKEVAGFFGRSV